MTTEAAVADKPVDTTPPAADKPTIAASTTDAPADKAPATIAAAETGADPNKPAEVADWRKRIADARSKGDEQVAAKVLKRLERFTDEAAYDEAFEQTQASLRESGKVKLPGKDATDEERAAFHKAIGVPEKEDGYKIALPKDVVLDEADQAQLKAITSYLHKRGGMAAAPDTVQTAAELFLELREQAQADFVAKGAQFAQESEKALRREWGQDFANNIAYTGPGLVALAGRDGDAIRTLQLADGGYLGDHPLFVKMLAQAGRIAGDDPILWEAAKGGGDAKSLEVRKAEIMKLRTSSASGDREKYAEASKPGGELSVINARLDMLQRKPAS